jgi:hypothetical protein
VTVESSAVEPPAVSSPPAGWYSDPEGRAAQRYWDGAAWGDWAPPAGPVRHGVLPVGRNLDLHVFGDRIVLEKVKGSNQQMVGMLAFGVIGSLIGQKMAANADAARIAETSWRSADELAASGAEVIPHDRIASLEARHTGGGGRIRLTLTDGKVRKLTWAKPSAKGLDVDRLLHDAAPTRSIVHALTTGRKVGRVVGLTVVVLWVVAAFGYVIFGGGGPADDPSSEVDGAGTVAAASSAGSVAPAAIAPLSRACEPWIAFAQKQEAPSVDEVKALLATVRPELQNAAAADPSLAAAADSATFLESYFTMPSPALEARVDPAAGDVDAACGRLR